MSTDLSGIHERLLGAGIIGALPAEPDGARLFIDCELASFAESRLGDRTDPRCLDEPRRLEWSKRATTTPPPPPALRRGDRCYWLLEGGVPVGTVALSTETYGRAFIELGSFYLFPDARGRGLGAAALAAIQRCAVEVGLGVRLTTHWSWQPALRFWCRRGLWVYMWKRELTLFSTPGLPAPSVEIDGRHAVLAIEVDGERQVLVRAWQRAGRLVVREARRSGPAEDHRSPAALADGFALGTLAVRLALAGWPLVRSERAWDRLSGSDCVHPESLAHRIQAWEAYDRHQGWRVDTPKIPGLEMPTWEELLARWNAP